MAADTNGLFWCISVATTDPHFLAKWRPAMEYESLPKGPAQFIYAAMLDHWDEHQLLVDEPTLRAYLRPDADAEENREIEELYRDIHSAFPCTKDSLPAATRVATEWVQSAAIGATLDKARASLNTGDREAALASLLNLRPATGVESRPPLVLGEDSIADVLANRPKPKDAIPTGLPEIDKLWRGGVYPGNLALIMAPTNVGKSMFLCWLAAMAYAADKRVFYFTYELTKTQIMERVLGAMFGTNISNIPADELDARFRDLR